MVRPHNLRRLYYEPLVWFMIEAKSIARVPFSLLFIVLYQEGNKQKIMQRLYAK